MTNEKKTEQEVRDSITEGLYGVVGHQVFEDGTCASVSDTILTLEEVRDLAVIIGKALGIIEGEHHDA